MDKLDFKKKVLDWIRESGVYIQNKKVKVYNTRRYGLEVRIYNEPMFFTNTKKSRRKIEDTGDGFNCTYGIHSSKVSAYTHINEDDFKNEDEKEFILESLGFHSKK